MSDASTPRDDDGQRGNTRRRVIGLYSWASRARWVASLFATRADVAVTLGALGLIGGVAATAVTDAVVRPDRAAGRIAAVGKRVGDSATLFGIKGRDEAGRLGAFDLVVLDKRFNWVRGSTTEIVKDGQVLPVADVGGTVLSAEVRQSLARATEVIAVGTASREGDLTAETHRAGLRARQTAEWVAAAVPPRVPVYTLNLGQYRDECTACETDDTSWQRPFVVVAVRDKEHGTDIAQALAAAMSDKSNLPSLSAYSTFGLTRFR